ncbi:hypothetical protein DEJ50_31910 [Streptomyces venezuelae]|uniref:Uncharacterized protein n=1 Tax=Streptomyces venezuelae TaxID=54571 RepID=A0A5P2DC33_STRVZ|nr:M64 family metallopeptidase [Streptomyces venezuelae]QES51777.1 hypothetical protein DEJ50_31910 [Streptomyces venezuelae]
MADELDDLVLLPHCDLHMALTGTPPLTLRVFKRTGTAGVTAPYTLTPVPPADCSYAFMAPYQDTGHRFDGVPTVDGNGVVHPGAGGPGVYLFRVAVGTQYLVGRLQVHRRLENWWFGNASLTTALDPDIGHALPTLYARFSDDNNAADLIGDITGHGYVTLTSEDPRKVAVTPNGRLRGLVETPKPPEGELPATSVAGTLGTLPERTLQVGVVDYRKERRILVDHQLWNLTDLDDMQNVLILAEGFEGSAADRAVFTQAAEAITFQLFSRRRHEPYGTLKERFNVFSAFEESFERGLTCGNRVTDTLDPAVPSGTLIPYENPVEVIRPGSPLRYAMAELVKRVGLPPRINTRTDLVQHWSGQQLHDFKPERVNEKLIKAWKTHRSLGILQTKNSFFGVMAGRRPADRTIGQEEPAPKPAQDAASPEMKAFVKQLYEFWTNGPTGLLVLDPRRHPPELYAPGHTNPLNSVLTYAKALGYVNPFSHVHRHIGQVWAAETPGLRRSRGLIAVVTYDYAGRGVNTNRRTMTLNSFEQNTKTYFQYDTASPIDPALMHRTVPAPDPAGFRLGDVVDMVAHEFGHTFNLGDEYEEQEEDGPGNTPGDLIADNLTRLGHARLNPTSRDLNMANVKWLQLPRMQHSARLVKDSELFGTPPKLRVTVDTDQLDVWRAVRQAGPGRNTVSLRQFKLLESGEQLPLDGVLLEGLTIDPIADGTGVLVLTGPNLPTTVFGAGSVLYVPLKDGGGTPLTVVDRRVLTFLQGNRKPLNHNTNNKIPRHKPDLPHRIPGLAPNELRQTLVGIFEGAHHYAGAHYRPAGACKMRNGAGIGEAGSFCFVCMWLIVNRVDPTHHATISRRFYPGRRR